MLGVQDTGPQIWNEKLHIILSFLRAYSKFLTYSILAYAYARALVEVYAFICCLIYSLASLKHTAFSLSEKYSNIPKRLNARNS